MGTEELTQYLEASGLFFVSSPHDATGISLALEKLAVSAQSMNGLAKELLKDAAVRYLIHELGVKRAARIVDAAFKSAPQLETNNAEYPVIVPTGSAVDNHELIRAVIACLERFLFLPLWGALKLALWVLFTYVWDIFDDSPQLAVTSAVSESGKSRVLDVLFYLVPKPWRASEASTASIFREIHKHHPTVLLDEIDNVNTKDR